MSRTYAYFLDLFINLDIPFEELAEMFEAGKLKPFELVRGMVEKELGTIMDVKLFASYFNPEKPTVVLEYMVACEKGHVSVKIIHAVSPSVGLVEYQKAERQGLVKKY